MQHVPSTTARIDGTTSRVQTLSGGDVPLLRVGLGTSRNDDAVPPFAGRGTKTAAARKDIFGLPSRCAADLIRHEGYMSCRARPESSFIPLRTSEETETALVPPCTIEGNVRRHRAEIMTSSHRAETMTSCPDICVTHEFSTTVGPGKLLLRLA